MEKIKDKDGLFRFVLFFYDVNVLVFALHHILFSAEFLGGIHTLFEFGEFDAVRDYLIVEKLLVLLQFAKLFFDLEIVSYVGARRKQKEKHKYRYGDEVFVGQNTESLGLSELSPLHQMMFFECKSTKVSPPVSQ